MADGKIILPFKWVAGIALAAVIAGAGAVYVTSMPSGNGDSVVSSSNQDNCKADEARQAAVKAAAIGDVAAFLPSDPENLGPLAFQSKTGEPMTLQSFAGKTILVNLWATWCAPCRKEMPALDRLEQQMGGDEFQVVAINIDTGDAAKARTFLDEVGVVALEDYRDPSMGIFNEFKKRSLALGLPATVIVDPQGCLVGKLNGPAEWDSEDALSLIEASLGRTLPES